jgi:hypothetical protein
MRRLACLLALAGCHSTTTPPSCAPLAPTTLYESYCASAPQTICFVDHEPPF